MQKYFENTPQSFGHLATSLDASASHGLPPPSGNLATDLVRFFCPLHFAQVPQSDQGAHWQSTFSEHGVPSLQGCSSSSEPLQGKPVLEGWTATFRSLLAMPPSHVVLHAPQEAQSPNLQSIFFVMPHFASA